MTKVLVPFTDPDSAERALRRLLEEPPAGPLEVELLAIAEPPNLTTVRRFVSARTGEEVARAAAVCWIARLGPLLQEANVPFHARVVVGNAPAEIEAALHRTDVDRVLVSATAPRWPATTPAVTIVS
jgi:hypothetical protein